MNEADPELWTVLLAALFYLLALAYAVALALKPGQRHRRFWIACAALMVLGTTAAVLGAVQARAIEEVPTAFALGVWCVLAGMVGACAGALARLVGRWRRRRAA
jgi:drug/metabolite transporter (DMT)-like permease